MVASLRTLTTVEADAAAPRRVFIVGEWLVGNA